MKLQNQKGDSMDFPFHTKRRITDPYGSEWVAFYLNETLIRFLALYFNLPVVSLEPKVGIMIPDDFFIDRSQPNFLQSGNVAWEGDTLRFPVSRLSRHTVNSTKLPTPRIHRGNRGIALWELMQGLGSAFDSLGSIFGLKPSTVPKIENPYHK